MSKKENIQAKKGNRKYGIFSMLALIVGVVIGSGIFVKNDNVFGETGSAVWSLITWGIISIIILLMVFAFLEINSSSKKKGKPGTISSWGYDFISPKAGKWIGIFIALVMFPITAAAFPQWITETIATEAGASGDWNLYAMTFGFGLLILLFIFAINVFSQKTSKSIGIGGMCIKTIPLLFVIIASLVFVFLNKGTSPGNIPDVDTGNTRFEGIMLAMPAILYTFDGFLYGASMENEAKNKNTFIIAFVGGMVFVALIYVLYSLGIFSTIGSGESFSLKSAIYSIVGENNYRWVSRLMQGMVVISIISGFNGLMVTGIKSMSGLSLDNTIADKNGNMIKMNKQQSPQFSAYRMLMFAVGWFLLFKIFDAISLVAYPENGFMYVTNFSTDLTVVISFLIYVIILIGGVVNRFTKRTEVEKNWYFVPTALFVIGAIIFIVGFQFYNIIEVAINDQSFMKLTTFLLIAIGWISFYVYNNHMSNKLTPKELSYKKIIAKEFIKNKVSTEFKNKKSRPFLVK